MSEKFFVTTAIDYVNSTPHLGTAYEKIGADVLARFARWMGKDTLFLMGADEHSANVEKQARAEGIIPQVYCDRMSAKFQEVWRLLDISCDDFVRTSQPRHHKAVGLHRPLRCLHGQKGVGLHRQPGDALLQQKLHTSGSQHFDQSVTGLLAVGGTFTGGVDGAGDMAVLVCQRGFYLDTAVSVDRFLRAAQIALQQHLPLCCGK